MDRGLACGEKANFSAVSPSNPQRADRRTRAMPPLFRSPCSVVVCLTLLIGYHVAASPDPWAEPVTVKVQGPLSEVLARIYKGSPLSWSVDPRAAQLEVSFQVEDVPRRKALRLLRRQVQRHSPRFTVDTDTELWVFRLREDPADRPEVWIPLARNVSGASGAHALLLLSAHRIPCSIERWGVLMVREPHGPIAAALLRADAEKGGYGLDFIQEAPVPDRLPWRDLSVLLPYRPARSALRKTDGVDFPALLRHPKVKKEALQHRMVTTIRYRTRQCLQVDRRSGQVRYGRAVEAQIFFSDDLLNPDQFTAMLTAEHYELRASWFPV